MHACLSHQLQQCTHTCPHLPLHVNHAPANSLLGIKPFDYTPAQKVGLGQTCRHIPANTCPSMSQFTNDVHTHPAHACVHTTSPAAWHAHLPAPAPTCKPHPSMPHCLHPEPHSCPRSGMKPHPRTSAKTCLILHPVSGTRQEGATCPPGVCSSKVDGDYSAPVTDSRSMLHHLASVDVPWRLYIGPGPPHRLGFRVSGWKLNICRGVADM
jgi:hypothetical protein